MADGDYTVIEVAESPAGPERLRLTLQRDGARIFLHLPRETVAVLQALRRDGRLVDDFAYARAPRQVHVLNAPSPAATAALEIARQVADEVTSDR